MKNILSLNEDLIFEFLYSWVILNNLIINYIPRNLIIIQTIGVPSFCRSKVKIRMFSDPSLSTM